MKLRMANIQSENRIHDNENAKAGVFARGFCVNVFWTDTNATSNNGIFSILSLNIQNIYKRLTK